LEDGADVFAGDEHMPVETRSVVFSADDLKTALKDFICYAGQRIPSHAPLAATLLNEEPVRACLTVGDELWEFDVEEIEQACVDYCLHHHIALPLHGVKSVIAQNGAVVLIVQTRPRPVVASDIGHAPPWNGEDIKGWHEF
jgi:hypothetical protein